MTLMKVADLKALSPAERTKLAIQLGKKGEEIGHELARQGHPIVVSRGTFTFDHAEEKRTTGTYADATNQAVLAAAFQQAAREITEQEPTSRMPPFYWAIGLCYVGGLIGSRLAEGPVGFWITVTLLAGVIVLIPLTWWKRSSIVREDKARRAEYEWLKDTLTEPIWAGCLIALSDYEEERLSAQKEAEVAEAKERFLASQPFYPTPPAEMQPVSITQPMHKDLWNPPPRRYRSKPTWSPTKPGKRRQAKTFRQAEIDCVEWLRLHGEPSAQLTQDGADGGVDIISNRFVCQVKNYAGSVGVPPIRALYGVSAAEGKSPLFFSTGDYTNAAIEFADKVNMPLFVYDARTKDCQGANYSARKLLSKKNL